MGEFRHAEKNSRKKALNNQTMLMHQMDEHAFIQQNRNGAGSGSDLQISDPADAHEQEADAVAKKVVNGESADVKTRISSADLNAKNDTGAMTASSELQNTINSSKSGGQAIEDQTRS